VADFGRVPQVTRLGRIVAEIGRLLPEKIKWHIERFEQFKDKGPFKLLIQIVLSHQTTIKIEDLTIEQLWSKFTLPEQLARAKFEEVDALIKNVNYHPTKARRIIQISRAVTEKWGGDLNFLHRLPLGRSLDELSSLPGVGRKTAAIVLLSIFDKPIMPVDTNVFRVTKDLRLASKKDDPETVSKKLEKMLPEDPQVIARAHNSLLTLGQATSRGRNRELLERLRSIG